MNMASKKSEKEISFKIPFGPQHPASGHFHASVEVEGERVVDLKPFPGYLHRGFEKLMEYRIHPQNSALVDRICILEPYTWELGYANAIEKLSGVEAPERGKFIRTIMTELGRILSHVTWIGILSLALGHESANKIGFGDREKILQLNEIISGGRLYPCYIVPGGVRRDITEKFIEKTFEVLAYFEEQLKLYDSLLFKNETFIERTRGVGEFPSADKAIELGASGPNLRGCGVKADLRKDEPYDAYPETDFTVPVENGRDAYARSLVRRREIPESISIVRQLLDKLPDGKFRAKTQSLFAKSPEGESHFCLESARGEGCYHIVSDGKKNIYRAKVRGPSFSHALSEFPYLAVGGEIADVPIIYWSLDSCPSDMDR